MTMAKTFEELNNTAETIRTNVLPESNTAGLVGQMLKDIVEKIREAFQKSAMLPALILGKGSVKTNSERVVINYDSYSKTAEGSTYTKGTETLELPPATETSAGVMTAADKKRLNSGTGAAVAALNSTDIDDAWNNN
jgi:hypothetical protein